MTMLNNYNITKTAQVDAMAAEKNATETRRLKVDAFEDVMGSELDNPSRGHIAESTHLKRGFYARDARLFPAKNKVFCILSPALSQRIIRVVWPIL